MGVRQTAGYVEARVDMRALCFVIPLQDAKLPSRHDLCLGSFVKNGGSTVDIMTVVIMVVVTLISDESDYNHGGYYPGECDSIITIMTMVTIP